MTKNEDGTSCSLHVLDDASSKVDWFLVLFRKLRYVFLDTPAGHDPRSSSVFLHGIDLDFNSIQSVP